MKARTGTRRAKACGPICSMGHTQNFDEFRANLEAKARSADPLIFSVIDNASGRAVGYQTLMRIEPPIA